MRIRSDRFIAELRERFARAAAGVVVVPARRVECPTRESSDAGNHWQLHEVQDPNRQHVITAGKSVAAIGVDSPPASFVVPYRLGDFGVEQGVDTSP